MECAVVEATDGGERMAEEELKLATKEFTSEAPAAPLEPTGKHRTQSSTLLFCVMLSHN